MKSIGKFFLLVICVGIYSCTKVIDLDLRDSETKYVIEGIITNEPGVCKVYLSQTKNFNENNQFRGVSGATVKVKDNGREILLAESQPGTYQTTLINGTPGHRYELSVIIRNEIFTASCTMPHPVYMDSLYISKGPFGMFEFATIAYTDPAGRNNGYRFVQYVNGVKEPTIFWEDDEFTDGQMIITQLDASEDEEDDPRNIKTGDEVMVEMLSLDEPILKYWLTLRSGGGNGEGDTAAPANPVTNIQGGALGYFSAHALSRKKVIAP
jgi:hypothetical protein